MKLAIFSIFLALSTVIGANNPDWSKNSFIAKGVILMPYGNIEEPFEAWMDPAAKRSRLDYYGGMNSIIFLDGPGFKIVPKPPGSDVDGDMICYNVTGGIGYQSILPDISKFTKSSDISRTCKHKGSFEHCTYYTYTEKNEGKVNTYEMAVFQDKIPIQYNFTGYDTLMGSHYDQYTFVYLDYREMEIPPGVFDYPARMRNCPGYPGPGVSSSELNPLAELMGDTKYSERDEDTSSEFEMFKKKYTKNYDSDIEHESRKSIFRQARRYINSKNRQNLGYTLAINHLADQNENELKLRNGYRYSGIGESHRLNNEDFVLMDSDIPDSINWVEKGAVNPPKDQGICGSCWSFGTTGTLEGSYFLKYQKLLDLSEQSLIDCTWSKGNDGCDGGETERVGEWMEANKTNCVVTRAEYAAAASANDTKLGYLMADGICHLDKTKKDDCVWSPKYIVSPQGDLDALRQFSAIKGPIQVAIDASLSSFSFYSSGIYYDEACGNKPENLDHSVLLVGYGSENGQNYWLVKNSWSTHWGDGGYVKMSTKDNNCGVATDAVYFEIA